MEGQVLPQVAVCGLPRLGRLRLSASGLGWGGGQAGRRAARVACLSDSTGRERVGGLCCNSARPKSPKSPKRSGPFSRP